MSGENGWNEWKNHILLEIQKYGERLDKIDQKINRLCYDISALKVKAGLWGAIAGIIPVITYAIIQFLKQ